MAEIGFTRQTFKVSFHETQHRMKYCQVISIIIHYVPLLFPEIKLILIDVIQNSIWMNENLTLINYSYKFKFSDKMYHWFSLIFLLEIKQNPLYFGNSSYFKDIIKNIPFNCFLVFHENVRKKLLAGNVFALGLILTNVINRFSWIE